MQKLHIDVPLVDDLIDKVETPLLNKLKEFISESGKLLAGLIFLAIGMISSGELLNTQIIEIIFGLGILIVALILYFILWIRSKEKKELIGDLVGLALNHLKLGEDFTALHNDCSGTKEFLAEMKTELQNVKDDNQVITQAFNDMGIILTRKREINNHLDAFIEGKP